MPLYNDDAFEALEILKNVFRWGEYVSIEGDYVQIDASKIDITPEQKATLKRIKASVVRGSEAVPSGDDDAAT